MFFVKVQYLLIDIIVVIFKFQEISDDKLKNKNFSCW